jgi:starch synthase
MSQTAPAPVATFMLPRETGLRIAAVIPGKEPYDPHTWSGCSPFFLDSLERTGTLRAAVGAYVPPAQHRALAMLVPHPNIARWKLRANANVLQRRLATYHGLRRLERIDSESYDTILQALALCDFTGRPRKRTVAYLDTNLLTMTKWFPERAPADSAILRAAIRYEARIYERASILFTMSRWAADTFIHDLGIPASKLEPIGAGINIEQPEPLVDKRYDTANILMVGRDFPLKGGYTLLEAFELVRAQLPHATLTLMGPRNLKNLPQGVNTLNYVSKRTEQGMAALRDAYRRASVFVLPSIWEPFGIAVLEAQAYGLPCVGTDGFAMQETIMESGAGYVIPRRDPRALARALVDLLKDPLMCEQMGANGQRRQQSYYTWDGVARRIVERLR